MNILTVGPCPYLLTKLGKIHTDVINILSKDDHIINSAVWHLDLSWFMPNDNGKYIFEQDGKKKCEMHPFSKVPVDKATIGLYEIVKKIKPDVVVSIFDYVDMSPLNAIKTLDPNAFKWISILAIDSSPINEKMIEFFVSMDSIITTTKQANKEISENINVDCQYIPYGSDHDVFFVDREDKIVSPMRIMSCAKNSQSSNIAAFILSIKYMHGDVAGYLHTNHSSLGDYDLETLIERYDLSSVIELPKKFVSINDGIDACELNKEYNKSDIIVDVSVRSSTALSLLEGMSAGCIPVITNVGALKEVVEMLPRSYRFIVESITYIGDNGKEYQVASPEGIAKKILYIKNIRDRNPTLFDGIRNCVVGISKKFCNKFFAEKVKEVVEGIKVNSRSISIEVF